MLGTLTRYLRMCGFDAAYALDRDVESDDALLSICRDEGRTLITRDRQLAARADAKRSDRADAERPDCAEAERPDRAGDVHLLTERDVLDQLRELDAAGFELSVADPPVRCGRCNGLLERDPAGADRPEYVPDDEQPVWRCRDCGQRFWKGSHWDDVRDRLDRL